MGDDDRIILRQQSNLGAAAARNAGWRAAAAPLIAFLDADDEWDRGKLEAQIHLLNACPEVVAVGSMMRYVSDEGRPLGTTGQPVGEAEQMPIRRGELFPFPMSSLVVRRDALERVGGFDAALGPRADGAFIGAEDLDLLARLAEVGRIACVAAPLGSYRIHANSAMAMRRQRISLGSRFVRRRQAARHAGGDLSWDQFIAQGQRTWREGRQDAVEALYRHAAVSYADRQFARMAGRLMLAAIVDARYTVRRLLRQAAALVHRENVP
jgi:GT2 family glycosyltransferase